MQTYLAEYNALKRQIDALRASAGDAELESRKGDLLKSCTPYMDFIGQVTDERRTTLCEIIDECAHFLATDTDLKTKFELLARQAQSGVATGEIRVHSYTLFVIART